MKLFFDIETIPASASNQSILRNLYEKRPGYAKNFEEYLRGTSLQPNWGQVFCIGFAQDDQSVDVLIGTEEEILTNFWQMLKKAKTIIGHNILEFDLPFIWKRSIINNIVPPIKYPDLEMLAFDTMLEWDLHKKPSTALHQLALIFGFPTSKDSMDGSQVYDYYLADREQDIYDYCKKDVELTRQVFHRMNLRSY